MSNDLSMPNHQRELPCYWKELRGALVSQLVRAMALYQRAVLVVNKVSVIGQPLNMSLGYSLALLTMLTRVMT